jgi:hypothetical protein
MVFLLYQIRSCPYVRLVAKMGARVDSVQVVNVAEQSGAMYGKQSCDIAGFLLLRTDCRWIEAREEPNSSRKGQSGAMSKD